MNASLQCLRRINEFKESILKYKGNKNSGDIAENTINSLQKLFLKLETSGDRVTPLEFFSVSSNY